MIILGIESSCDETAASVVKDGRELLSNVVFSSMDLHKAYGGVVPEIAARSHIESIIPVIDQAITEAFGGQGSGSDDMQGGAEEAQQNVQNGTLSEHRKQPTQHSAENTGSVLGSAQKQDGVTSDLWDKIDAIAVTYGAGLGGSLLVGVMTARTLSITKKKPLYAINHVEAHVYANFLTETQLTGYQLPTKQPEFPILALIVSGGHSQLVLFRDHFDYTLLGQTRDDAIGEAFDKVAKVIGLPYPGGPSVAEAAKNGDSMKYKFPKSKLDHKYEFSFSGIKTAVLRLAQEEIGEDFTFPSHMVSERLSVAQMHDIAASFQRIAIETVVDKTVLAYEEFNPKSVVIAGGVAANQELRRQLTDRIPIEIQYTDIKLCTDNGAMVATLGCYKAMLGQPTADPYSLQIEPNLSM
jgi:N6-L-threonylcarbamoyladenine synthase